jgi:hypothetical protein
MEEILSCGKIYWKFVDWNHAQVLYVSQKNGLQLGSMNVKQILYTWNFKEFYNAIKYISNYFSTKSEYDYRLSSRSALTLLYPCFLGDSITENFSTSSIKN